MKSKTKLIENINDDNWNKFVGYCKVDGKKVGESINNLIKEFINKKESGEDPNAE